MGILYGRVALHNGLANISGGNTSALGKRPNTAFDDHALTVHELLLIMEPPREAAASRQAAALAKPLKGMGSGVVELIEDFDGDTYRAVYTVRFATAIYVLHAFKKKSKQGIKTPQSDVDLVKRRLKDAEADNAAREKQEAKR